MLNRNKPVQRPAPTTQRFMFATGIECSYPTIKSDKGVVRQDELRKCGHYDHWKEDLELTVELGIRFLRYGPPLYTMHVAPGRYDWDWTDMVLPVMQKLGIVPIMDLCHFGVPDWVGSFQDPDFPRYFAEYARAFATRYPWVRLYTPVNEMFVAAEFSAWYGWWNERLTSDQAFVTALKNIVRANREAMQQILDVKPDALFIQSESSEYTHTMNPRLQDRAEFFNDRRFLSLDLNYGHRVNSMMYEYLMEHGMTLEEYHYFMNASLREHCVMGNDYYVANEHILVEEDKSIFAGETFGYYVITSEYYNRYNLPVMHTETNKAEPDAERWLWKTWANIQRLRKDGVPMVGMTWFSLTDQVDWDTALREDNGTVNPLGLFDLNRNIRPVGKAYKELIDRWNEIPLLPNGPLTLLGDGFAHPPRAHKPSAKETHAKESKQAAAGAPHPTHARQPGTGDGKQQGVGTPVQPPQGEAQPREKAAKKGGSDHAAKAKSEKQQGAAGKKVNPEDGSHTKSGKSSARTSVKSHAK